MQRPIALCLALAAASLYATSLFLPAFACTHTKSFLGYAVLAMGWFGLLGLDPRWFANAGFVVLLSACLSKQSKPHPLALTITVVLALTSFAPAAGCEGGGGAPEMSSGLALGGYLWVIAMLLICVANLSWREPDAATSAVPNDDD